MPKPLLPIKVRRLVGDMTELLHEQGIALEAGVEAHVAGDEHGQLKALVAALRKNSQMSRIATLIEAGQLQEAEDEILRLRRVLKH